MIIKSFKKYFSTYIVPTFYGGGSGGGQNTTVQQRNIPRELAPYYELLLNASTKQLFTTADNPGPVKAKAPTYTPKYESPVHFAKGGEVKKFAAGGTSMTDALRNLGVLGQNNAGDISPTGIAGYTPYGMDPSTGITDFSKYVAQPSPLQEQSYKAAKSMTLPEQTFAGSNLVAAAGTGAMNTAGTGLDYGGSGYDAGINAANIGNNASNVAAQNANILGNSALNYGGRGYEAGLNAAGIGNVASDTALTNANIIGNSALGYGARGYEAGLNAGNIGSAAADTSAQNANILGNSALNYGGAGAISGAAGQMLGVLGGGQYGELATGYGKSAAGAGTDFANQVRNSGTVGEYMNPYIEQSLKPQLDLMNQQNDIANQKANSQAAQNYAYGGSRALIQNALNDQSNKLAKANVIGQGYNTGYTNAISNIGKASDLGMQGAQTGIQGAQTGLQGVNAQLAGTSQGMQGAGVGLAGVGAGTNAAQYGLSGAGTGIQGAQTAMQGAGMGLQGAQTATSAGQYGLSGAQTGISGQQAAMQGAGVGLSGVGAGTNAGQYGLSGAQTGISGQQAAMQGAQTGLSGVGAAQQGYSLAGAQGANLANIGNQQLAQQQSIAGMQNTYGAQQQSLDQQAINNAISMNDLQQRYPWELLGNFANTLNGVQTGNLSAFTPAASPLSQVAGLAATGVGAYNAFKKKGGVIKKPKAQGSGIGDLAVYNAMKGGK